MLSARRLAVVLGGSVSIALGALCGLAAPAAVANRAHAYDNLAFGGTGETAGDLSLAVPAKRVPGSGIAVNNSVGDVYVADTGNRRVDEFSSTGAFVRAWGWGVSTGAPELQVCTATCQRGLSGTNAGEFVAPVYVAVDNAPLSASRGDIYVGDTGTALVSKFDHEGHLISSWGNNGENGAHEHVEPNGQLNGTPTELFDQGNPSAIELSGVAVDDEGGLFVINTVTRLFKFGQDGASLHTCSEPTEANVRVAGIAVGPRGIDLLDGLGRTGLAGLTCASYELLTGLSHEGTGLALDTLSGELEVDMDGVLIQDIPVKCTRAPDHTCRSSQVFGEGLLTGASGVAVDPALGSVYVANGATNRILAFALSVEATILAASAVTAHTATLHGTVNPVGTELSLCRFEYGETEEYGLSAPCAESVGSIGEGNAPVEVHADLTGLDGGRTYHFRLHAINGKGTVVSEDEQLLTTQTARIEAVSASELAASSATLNAKVNPHNLAAHYHFEYGPCSTASECFSGPYPSKTPEPDGSIPAGETSVTISQHVEGLTPGLPYHFRIAVEDVAGLATPSPEGVFVFDPPAPSCEGHTASLPDCRADELVTPPDKNGALIDNGGGEFLTAPAIAGDGSSVLAKSIQCFHGPESCTSVRATEGEPYRFARTVGGWLTETLAPPASAGNTMLSYNAETGLVLYAIAGNAPAREQFYAREVDGTLNAIGPVGELPGTQITNPASNRMAQTADLSHLVYQSVAGLWPSLEMGLEPEKVFEYTSWGQTTPVLVGTSGASSLISACGTSIGAYIGGGRDSLGAISADGRSVVFTAAACEHGTGENSGVTVPADELFARVEGSHGVANLLLSGPGPEATCHKVCEEQEQHPGDATFEGASADGSHVFFTSTQQLTDTATEDRRAGDSAHTPGCANTASDSSGCNLYLSECATPCETASSRRLLDLSAGDSSGLGPVVRGVMAIPADGSDAFFVARGVLTETPNHQGLRPVAGGENLYVYTRGAPESSGHLTFIATLSSVDSEAWVEGIGRVDVTPEGRYLVFTSHKGLTADTPSGLGPAQVYRYDTLTEELIRVSIGTDGFNDDGNAAIADARIAPHVPLTGGYPRMDPTMSHDGRFVFFQSPTALTPGALNNEHVTGNTKVLAQNVYEWEADGAGLSAGAPACTQAGGCVSLISDGHDLAEGSGVHGNFSAVELLGTDATGSNVFFWTANQLAPTDTDSQVDLYDARVEGGFPAPEQAPSCGSLTECHQPPPPESVFGALASSTFSGFGNAEIGSVVPLPHVTQRHAPGEKLAAVLKSCRTKPAGHVRQLCERRARSSYQQQLLAGAVRACHKKAVHLRAACENRARARYRVQRMGRAHHARTKGGGAR